MLKYSINKLNYFPLTISIVFLTSVLFGDDKITNHMILSAFKNYISMEEKDMINEMLGNFNEENMGDLLDLLSDYHCRKKPTADSLKGFWDRKP